VANNKTDEFQLKLSPDSCYVRDEFVVFLCKANRFSWILKAVGFLNYKNPLVS
jgi:hypothetical protein